MIRLLFIQAVLFSIFIDCSGTPEIGALNPDGTPKTTEQIAEEAKAVQAKIDKDLEGRSTVEKLNHFEALTDVVESLAGGVGLGNNCLAHHLYIAGTMKAAKAAGTLKLESVKEANYSEPVVSGLIAVDKADVYVLKQIVETSQVVLKGLTDLETVPAKPTPAVKDAAPSGEMIVGEDAEAVKPDAKVDTAVANTDLTKEQTDKIADYKTRIGTVLKANLQHAMSTLGPVEEAIYGFVAANKSAGLLNTITTGNTAAVLAKSVSKLAIDTSAMIEGYFTALKTVGIDTADKAKDATTGLTGLMKTKTAAGNALINFGATEAITDGSFFEPAQKYQVAFKAYVEKLAKDGAMLKKVVAVASVNAVVGMTPVTTAGGAEAALNTARETYLGITVEKLTDSTDANGSGSIICGRAGGLTAIVPALVAA